MNINTTFIDDFFRIVLGVFKNTVSTTGRPQLNAFNAMDIINTPVNIGISVIRTIVTPTLID